MFVSNYNALDVFSIRWFIFFIDEMIIKMIRVLNQLECDVIFMIQMPYRHLC